MMKVYKDLLKRYPDDAALAYVDGVLSGNIILQGKRLKERVSAI